MEEAMTHTGDNYGTDGRVKLPNFTEDVDWKGLEDLYSVNESLYGYRNNYRLSLEDWANYLKNVDRVFALLNNNSKEIRTNKTVVAQRISGASPVQTMLVEMPSAESEEEFSGQSVDERGPSMKTHVEILNLSTVTLSHKKKLETKNDIPEGKNMNQAHWSNRQKAQWTEHIDLDTYEVAFSGNGLTELESNHHLNHQTVSYLLSETQEHSSHASEDIFEDQVYLPFQPEPFVKNISIAEKLTKCENLEAVKNKSKSDQLEEMCKNINIEGSASFPLSSD